MSSLDFKSRLLTVCDAAEAKGEKSVEVAASLRMGPSLHGNRGAWWSAPGLWDITCLRKVLGECDVSEGSPADEEAK